MIQTPQPASPRPPSIPLVLAGLLLAAAGCAAAWVILAITQQEQLAFLALVAALDAILVTRLLRVPRGGLRALLAVATTALCIAISNWWIAAVGLGAALGFSPWDALQRTGPALAWTLSAMANNAADWAWYVAALVLAAVYGR